MSVLDRAALNSKLLVLINNNTTGDITPAKLRDILDDIIDSFYNPTDDGLPATSAPTYREVTAAGAITVLVTDQIIGVNKTVGAATSVNLGPAASRNGVPLVIKDVKRDADVNNITPVADGVETIDGQAADVFTIVSPGDTLKLLPITGGWLTIP